jgi:hypothetical protein
MSSACNATGMVRPASLPFPLSLFLRPAKQTTGDVQNAAQVLQIYIASYLHARLIESAAANHENTAIELSIRVQHNSS